MRKDRAAFEAYQSAQVGDVFPIDAVLASFIVTDACKTAFVGFRPASRSSPPLARYPTNSATHSRSSPDYRGAH